MQNTANTKQSETSTLFNLRELMQMEDARIEAEREAERAAAEAERRARDEATRRAREAEAAAARERVEAEERRKAEERLAMVEARLASERAERVALAELELRQREAMARAMAAPIPETSPRAPSSSGGRWLLVAIAMLTAGLGALGYGALWAPQMAALEARAEAAARLADSRQGAVVALERELELARSAPVVTAPAPEAPAEVRQAPKRTTPLRGKTARERQKTERVGVPLGLDDLGHDPLRGIGG